MILFRYFLVYFSLIFSGKTLFFNFFLWWKFLLRHFGGDVSGSFLSVDFFRDLLDFFFKDSLPEISLLNCVGGDVS